MDLAFHHRQRMSMPLLWILLVELVSSTLPLLLTSIVNMAMAEYSRLLPNLTGCSEWIELRTAFQKTDWHVAIPLGFVEAME